MSFPKEMYSDTAILFFTLSWFIGGDRVNLDIFISCGCGLRV